MGLDGVAPLAWDKSFAWELGRRNRIYAYSCNFMGKIMMECELAIDVSKR